MEMKFIVGIIIVLIVLAIIIYLASTSLDIFNNLFNWIRG